MKTLLVTLLFTLAFSLSLRLNAQNKWVSLAGGYGFSLGIQSEGTLWAWGYNSLGQLGDGTTTDRYSSVQIGIDHNWQSVTVTSHTLAIKTDGTLWAWGYNGYGQLGEGTTIDRNSPVQVGTQQDWVKVAAGYALSVAIKSDGTLWAWGFNRWGQVGNGTTIDQYRPVQISGDHNWVSVTANHDHCLAIKADGTLWAWGANGSGQLGDGTTIEKHSPMQIGTDHNWVSISAGFRNAHGIKSDGTLWAWGINSDGELGNGTTIDQINLIQIGTGKQWTSIVSGWFCTYGLQSDGTLWAWGNNSFGQLGDGTITGKDRPHQIGMDRNWISLAAGSAFCLGLKSDRSQFCATGDNQFGQLGDSTITSKIGFDCIIHCKPPAAPTASDQMVCSGSKALLSATGIGTLSWYTAAVEGTYLGGGSTYQTDILSDDITFYVEDSTCAASVTRTAIKVTVEPLPKLPGPINITENNQCNPTPGTSFRLSAPSSFADSYQWKMEPSTAGKLTVEGLTAEIKWDENFSGSVSISVKGVNDCGRGLDAVRLTMLVSPISLQSAPLITQSCNVLEVQAPDYPLQWYLNDTLLTGENGKQLTLIKKGAYMVKIFGPCDTISAYQEAEPAILVQNDIPNVFTPNGDEWNETFQLAEKWRGAFLSLYNRWGKMVYESDNYQNDWNGQGLAAGPYYYYLKLPCQPKPLQGIITLLR